MESFISLQQSHKAAPAGTKIREVAPQEVLQIEVQLPMQASIKEIERALEEVRTKKRSPLTPKQIEKLLGAKSQHVRKVLKTAREKGLTPILRTAANRTHGIVAFSGMYSDYQKYFPGLKLDVFEDEHGVQFNGREGAINVLKGLPIIGVHGFDNRVDAHTNYRIAESVKGIRAAAQMPSGLTARGIAALQGWNLEEMDKVIRVTGFLSLDGDLERIKQDLSTLCGEAVINVPLVQRVPTDGVENGDYLAGSTVENLLDLLAQALLNPNGACLEFAAKNTNSSFAGGAEFAITYPGVKIGNKIYKLTVLTISWGKDEANGTQQSRNRWARIAISSQLAGIDIIAATGDQGPKDRTEAFTPDEPSSVGSDGAVIMGAAGIGIKTNMAVTSNPKLVKLLNHGFGAELKAELEAVGLKITSIFPWDNDPETSATGYGISSFFPPIEAEKRWNVTVSAVTGKPGHSASVFCDVGQPESGSELLYNGKRIKVAGTSLTAPFGGAKISYLKAALGIVSFQALLYQSGPEIVDQITEGDTIAPYPAVPNAPYNIMTGFGVINEMKTRAKVSK